MRAREISEGIMQGIGYGTGYSAGTGVNAAGAVAKGAGRLVKGIGKVAKNVALATTSTVSGALDALSGKSVDGLGHKVYNQTRYGQEQAPGDKSAQRTVIYRNDLPRVGEVYNHPKFGAVKVLAIGKNAVKLDTTNMIGHEIVVPLK